MSATHRRPLYVYSRRGDVINVGSEGEEAQKQLLEQREFLLVGADTL